MGRAGEQLTLCLGLWAMNGSALRSRRWIHLDIGFTHRPSDGEWRSSWDDLVQRWQVDRVTTWVGSDRQLRAGRGKARTGGRYNNCGRKIHFDVNLASPYLRIGKFYMPLRSMNQKSDWYLRARGCIKERLESEQGREEREEEREEKKRGRAEECGRSDLKKKKKVGNSLLSPASFWAFFAS